MWQKWKTHLPGMCTTSFPWWRSHAGASCDVVHPCVSLLSFLSWNIRSCSCQSSSLVTLVKLPDGKDVIKNKENKIALHFQKYDSFYILIC